MEFVQINEKSAATDLNHFNQANNIHNVANHKEQKVNTIQPEKEPAHNDSSSFNAQNAENEIATRISAEIVNQCYFTSTEMQTKEEKVQASENPSNSVVPTVAEQQEIQVEKDEQEEALKGESQPQPQRMMTLPAAIHIMNEFGQKTDSIDIDPNNNYHLTKLGSDAQKNSQSRRLRLTKEEKAAAVLIKNVSFGYTKNHNIISNISLHVPVGK